MARGEPPAGAGDAADDLEVIEVDDDPASSGDAPYRFLPHGHEDGAGARVAGRPRGSTLRSRLRSRRARVAFAVAVALVAASATTTTVALRRHHPPSGAVTLAIAPSSAASNLNEHVPPVLDAATRKLWRNSFVIGSADGVLVVDPKAGTIRNAPVSVAPNAALVDRSGRVVVIADGGHQVLFDLSYRAPILAPAHATFFPALAKGRFWTDSGTSVFGAGFGTIALPAGYEVLAQVAGPSLTFLLRNPAGDRLAVWAPSTDANENEPRWFPGEHQHVVASRADRVAWTGDDCSEIRCVLHVTDVVTLHDATIGFPYPPIVNGEPASARATGRFSPDGRYLAALAPDPSGPSGRLVVFDLRTATARVVAGVATSTVELEQSSSRVPLGAGLPFDWSPDSKLLLTLNVDTEGGTRLERIDVAADRVAISPATIPPASSLASLDLTPSTAPAPPLLGDSPLLGNRTGLVLAQLDNDNTLERLDLDTGTVASNQFSYPPTVTQNIDPVTNLPIADPRLTPMRGGAIFRNGYQTWWVPRYGPTRELATALGILPESTDRAWLVEANRDGTFALVPIDGSGEMGVAVATDVRPRAAVTNGFVEVVPATIDHPTSIEVYDPRTGARRTIGGSSASNRVLLAAAGNIVLWSGDCTTSDEPSLCGVRVTNVVTGITQSHDDWSARNVTLAPDGHALLYVPTVGTGIGVPTVLDLATGTTSTLPGANNIGGFVWGPDGWIFYGTDRGLGAWRPGLTSPRIVPGATELLGDAIVF
jgi:hypothetical protein